MLENILSKQREYFLKGETRLYKNRIKAISALEKLVRENEMEIYKAFTKDFGKSSFEVFMTEVGRLYKCFKYVKKNLKSWMSIAKVETSWTLKPAKSFIIREPYGTVLIISPNNYPLLLSLEPLLMAIAGGNTAIVKLPEATNHVSNLIENMIGQAFDGSYIHTIKGGVSETRELLSLRFDKIFFTGSSRVGKIVLSAAAENLTPVVLELGGKSPAIVCKTSHIKTAAKRIARGKLLNGGQTCIAPDFVLVDSKIKKKFLEELKISFLEFFGEKPIENREFTKMISRDYVKRLEGLLNETKGDIILGGEIDVDLSYISPTILDNVSWNDSLMKEEIFGPILPIIEFRSLDEEISRLTNLEKPLSLYVFSNKSKEIKKVLDILSFGGGVINDTLLHFANDKLPFGGVGNSGMGSSHGIWGFEEFVHKKAIMKRPRKFQVDFLKPPYGKKEQILRHFYK